MPYYTIRIPTIAVLSLIAATTLAMGNAHLNSEESIYERLGECGEPPLPDCQTVIEDANEQRLLPLAEQEALASAVESARSRARSNEVIVGVMPEGSAVVDAQLEFLSTSNFSVTYSSRRFQGIPSQCGNGRVWTNRGIAGNSKQARGWTGSFSYDSSFIGQTELKVGGFGPCAMIVTFVCQR